LNFTTTVAYIYTVIITTSVGDARLSVVGMPGWPVTVGVVEVGVAER